MNQVEGFPVGEYIEDELRERGWSHRDAAKRMPGDIDTNELWLDLLCCTEIWHDRPDFVFSVSEANKLEALLGISSEMLLNLHDQWREFHGLTPANQNEVN